NAGAGQLVKRDEVRAALSSRDTAGQNRDRQPVKRDSGLPVPTALRRHTARTAGQENSRQVRRAKRDDLDTWDRLARGQRRQPVWRARGREWQRFAVAKIHLLTLLAQGDRPEGLVVSVEEAQRLLQADLGRLADRALRELVAQKGRARGRGLFAE